MKAFIDVDGVLADLVGPLAAIHGFDMAKYPKGCYDLSKAFGKPNATIWNHPEVKRAEFWAGLPKLPWADELVGRIQAKHGEPCFLTQPVKDTSSLKGKADWIKRHFPGLPFLIGPKKVHLAMPGWALFDDSDDNVEGWRAKGGSAVLVPAPWNKRHSVAWTPLHLMEEA